MIGQDKRSGAVFVGMAALMLVALACTCGPLQSIQQAQGTVGAVQATVAPALTQLKQNEPTISAAMTEFKQNEPTLQALMSQNAPTVNAFMTQAGAAGSAAPGMQQTINALVPGFDATMAAIGGSGSGGGGSQDGLTHLFAVSASASSQHGNDQWSAQQATGAPTITQCGDNGSAWASADPKERATLTLTYVPAIRPSQIAIYHSYYPTSVVKVEVMDEAGAVTTVYSGQPKLVSVCPFYEAIPVSGVSGRVSTVIITVDQAQIGSWDEIDAVELIGTP